MSLTTKKFPLYLYTWSGWSADHKITGGQIYAPSISLARVELMQQGFTVRFLRKKIQFWRRNTRVPRNAIAIFFRQLATLVNAGITLVQSLTILAQTSHLPTHNLIKSLKNAIEGGKTLTHALRAHPNSFDPITCQLVHIAEQTGTLDVLLRELADSQEKALALKAKLKQALMYPCFILVMALFITMAMLMFIVPRFVEIFANFHAELPTLTRAIITISTFINSHYGVMLLPFIFYNVSAYYYKNSLPLKRIMDNFILKIPWLGIFLKKIIFVRITHTLAIMLTAGLTITNSLKMLADISTNHAIQTALEQLHNEINAGKRIHSAMQNITAFPPLLAHMIQVGEESGALETMLAKTAEFYESDIQYAVNNFSHLLEPLIIVILGVLIGGLVIAMYLPIFKLGTVFDG